MNKIAFLFPGQGSQTVGMGKDIYENFECARKIYDEASNILGLDIKRLCFEIDEENLNKTSNAQIAILVTSLGLLEVLKQKNITSSICAGLSLGEYTALIYSGILSFEERNKVNTKKRLLYAKLYTRGKI